MQASNDLMGWMASGDDDSKMRLRGRAVAIGKALEVDSIMGQDGFLRADGVAELVRIAGPWCRVSH